MNKIDFLWLILYIIRKLIIRLIIKKSDEFGAVCNFKIKNKIT